jgi:hypothetical protein
MLLFLLVCSSLQLVSRSTHQSPEGSLQTIRKNQSVNSIKKQNALLFSSRLRSSRLWQTFTFRFARGIFFFFVLWYLQKHWQRWETRK